jgi:fatty-acid desaturase
MLEKTACTWEPREPGGIHLEKPRKTNWPIVAVMSAFHVGAVAAFFMASWPAVVTAAILYWIAISMGIGMGYHRLLTHRSFKAPKPVEYFLAICGTLTLEGGPISWVGTHRVHHQKSDRDGDPHSPRHGGFWAHMGWVLCGQSRHNDTAGMVKLAPDLAKSGFYRWLNTYHYVPLIVSAAILAAVGGWSMVLWAVCVRVVLGLHSTWLVNSAAHMWGRRRFPTLDDSRNSWWVALLTFGEGWHNNHHAHPASARHGLAWYELDLTWIQIRTLQLVGLVKSAKVARLTSAPAELEAA